MQDPMNNENDSEYEQQPWIWGLDHQHSEMAARTTTDPATLAKMVEAVLSGEIPNDYAVSWALVGNENLPFESAAKLASAWGSEADLYLQVLERPDATPEALDAWADSDNLIAISMIAKHPNTKAETLVKLANHPHPLAPFWVIITGRLPQDLVDSFVSNQEAQVRVAVARVSNNPETLTKLATDPAEEVCLAVAQNPHADVAVIDQIARQEARPSPQMGRILGKRLVNPDLLETLAVHSDSGVRLAVARNPHTSAATCKELARNEQHPGPALCKVLGKRLDDPQLLQTVTSNASRPLAKVIYKSTNPAGSMRHIYSITMQPASRGRTKITISVKGAIIGERTTNFRRLFVEVCCANRPYELARLREEIARMRTLADLYEHVHLQVPGALAQLDQVTGIATFPAALREQLLAKREEDLAGGRFAEHMKATKAAIAKAETELSQLQSGQHTKWEKPHIKSWRQRREYVRRPMPWETLVDVLEIKVP